MEILKPALFFCGCHECWCTGCHWCPSVNYCHCTNSNLACTNLASGIETQVRIRSNDLVDSAVCFIVFFVVYRKAPVASDQVGIFGNNHGDERSPDIG